MADQNSGADVEQAVERVLDHLKNQRVGEDQARGIKDAAEKSLDRHERDGKFRRAIQQR